MAPAPSTVWDMVTTVTACGHTAHQRVKHHIKQKRGKVAQIHSPLRFMGRTRTATLTLESSRLGSPILTLPLRSTLIPNQAAPELNKHPKRRPASSLGLCSIGRAWLLQETPGCKPATYRLLSLIFRVVRNP